ncbi:MAG TPA: hypothetical protein VMZ91_08070 [Candidatus Paceibacterota bacterium]|nr:hypothetical protein [Candidatus Paceibacterota bacterium]
MKNTLISIGDSVNKIVYLNVDKTVAIERYIKSYYDDFLIDDDSLIDELNDSISIVEFDDELDVYELFKK